RDRIFGTIAQQVLTRGSVPVLLARPAADGSAAPFAGTTVLAALDGTAAAEKALTPAREMAQALRASLHLVMVVPTEDSARGDRPAATLLPAATRAVLDMEQDDAAGYLESLAQPLRASGLDVTTEVRRG